MPYVTLNQVKAALPADIVAQLLDDVGAGVPDSGIWTSIATAVQQEIDGRLGQRFTVPLPEPVPAVVTSAALVLAAEMLYHRKGYFGEHNPWSVRAQGIRGTMGVPGGQPGLLDKLASGEQQLTPTATPAKPVGGVLIEPSRLHSSGGNMLS